MSKKVRLNPKNATYKGCYQAKTKDGLIVYWVKVYIDGKWKKWDVDERLTKKNCLKSNNL